VLLVGALMVGDVVSAVAGTVADASTDTAATEDAAIVAGAIAAGASTVTTMVAAARG